MPRTLIRILFIALLAPVCVYAADTLVWRVHNATGAGMDEVTVTQVTTAALKRNREEYYVDGAITVSCARSIFPPLTAAGWLPPCWYLRRNHIVVTHV